MECGQNGQYGQHVPKLVDQEPSPDLDSVNMIGGYSVYSVPICILLSLYIFFV